MTAFNAFISTTVIVGQISFAIPAFLLLLRRRSSHYLPPKRPFRVPDVIGYLANIICVAWAVVVTVFFTFPTSFPVTGGNMSMYFPFPFLLSPWLRVVWVVLTDNRLCFGCVGGYVDIRDWELVCSCQVVLSWPEVGVVYRYD